MSSDRVVMARAVAHAAVRRTRSALAQSRTRVDSVAIWQGTLLDGRTVVVAPLARRRSTAPHGYVAATVSCAGEQVGELWTGADLGTATYEFVLRPVRAGADRAVLLAALRGVIDVARTRRPELRVAVRRSLSPDAVPVDILDELGLRLIATFPGDARSPRAWPGEQRWELC